MGGRLGGGDPDRVLRLFTDECIYEDVTGMPPV
jgi:hypothetical protein